MGLRLWALTLLMLAELASAEGQPRIAIIIDDLGYSSRHGQAIVDLPAAVTCAVIPFSPHGQRLARRASQAGKEVIVHMPMAAKQHEKLDRGGLTADMSEQELLTQVRKSLSQLPEARGLNNHMGSELTEQRQAMGWLMKELKAHQLFFVDSRTSGRSVAQRQAMQVGLANAGRDIFLDNDRSLVRINEQFNKLIKLARQRGHAIAIGHPYPETVHYLQQVLPLLKQAGIRVVPVSELLSTPVMNTASTQASDHGET
ncbi:divergent polysaccharide deacetylase family protein [Alcanivorax sediminis]|uniref:Divergent polysaccharide deacetylase family protein n=1 Tax=Alcanivorax sediminis TaxID=2663008 RepID=A0A6N7LX63_9GAMM|nr:divergent polysaccharide deacetylase family protein [Alcanivorax sediminis]MQX52720.1 divergent polysaccharide deacetylase family protein [Alcanivorax sediminis]